MKGAKDERRILIEALACVDVLRETEERGARDAGDWYFADGWLGKDRYDAKSVEALFGEWHA